MPQTKQSKGKRSHSKHLIIGITVMALLIGVAVVAPRFGDKQSVASAVELPEWLNDYPTEVREAYAYAAEHQDQLDYMSCYCGCENHGHSSNSSCYVKDIGPDGRIRWDSHAAT